MDNEEITPTDAHRLLVEYRIEQERHSLLCARSLWVEAGESFKRAERLFETLANYLRDAL